LCNLFQRRLGFEPAEEVAAVPPYGSAGGSVREDWMDDHHAKPVETGAAMDYAAHEKTYELFLVGAKWGTMVIAVLLIAMAAGFFGGAGILGSLVLFLVLNAAGFFLLR
jgi:hypothetical protein